LRKNKAHALASTTTSNQKKSRRFALTELTRGGAIQTVTGSGLLASKPAEVVVARMERLDLQKSLVPRLKSSVPYSGNMIFEIQQEIYAISAKGCICEVML
jgi:hypothetical protein